MSFDIGAYDYRNGFEHENTFRVVSRTGGYSHVIVTVMLREGVVPPPDAPWLRHGEQYTAVVVLVADQEAAVRILGPDGARCVMSTRDVRRLADDWPDH